MLAAGGARVTLAGFRRTAEPVGDVEGLVPIDLGVTRDGRFAQRMAALAKAAVAIGSALRGVSRPDLIIARNLEMLALAERAKARFSGGAVPVVYECLDIHRLVLGDNLAGRALRGAERYLGRDVRLLLTSSPAFVSHYFEPYGQIAAPVELLENKYFELSRGAAVLGGQPGPGSPPWRIGWFGALRCRRSLELLAAFSRRAQGRFEIVLRGRPALSEFPDFHGFVQSEPHLSFQGPYRNPEDMAAIYGAVHFAWAIDFFEEGQNSTWLLPNRLYEGCRFGAVPISMSDTETARFLDRRRIGLRLKEPTVESLEDALGGMNEARFKDLQVAVLGQNPKTWSYDRSDCLALVERLGRLAAAPGRLPVAALA